MKTRPARTRRSTPSQRLVALLFAGIFFVILLPLLLLTVSPLLDGWFRLPSFDFGLANYLVGVLLISCGWLLAMWSIWLQFNLGEGTPLPFLPTQKLITEGPYAFSRNPMALGAMILYLGIAVWAGSLAAVFLVILLSLLLILYIIEVEEKELEKHYSFQYHAYRRRTPFLIPRLPEKADKPRAPARSQARTRRKR